MPEHYVDYANIVTRAILPKPGYYVVEGRSDYVSGPIPKGSRLLCVVEMNRDSSVPDEPHRIKAEPIACDLEPGVVIRLLEDGRIIVPVLNRHLEYA